MCLVECIGHLKEKERLRGHAYFHDKNRRSIVDSVCVSAVRSRKENKRFNCGIRYYVICSNVPNFDFSYTVLLEVCVDSRNNGKMNNVRLLDKRIKKNYGISIIITVELMYS